MYFFKFVSLSAILFVFFRFCSAIHTLYSNRLDFTLFYCTSQYPLESSLRICGYRFIHYDMASYYIMFYSMQFSPVNFIFHLIFRSRHIISPGNSISHHFGPSALSLIISGWMFSFRFRSSARLLSPVLKEVNRQFMNRRLL